MLVCLRVHQFAIIDELEVAFNPGFNVLSGETGAGKSILVDALHLVLGARGRSELVRTGASQAEVEALFDVSDDAPLRARLAEMGFEDGEELVLRRVNANNGRTRAYVNGRLATATQLRELAAGLVDLSSQHEYQTLADSACHLAYLDAYGRLEAASAQVAAAWQALVQAQAGLDAFEQRISRRAEREDLLRYQQQEISSLAPSPGEDDKLEEEAGRLAHAEQLSAVTTRGVLLLDEGERNVCARLAAYGHELEAAVKLDPHLEAFYRLLESARLELQEVARDLGRYARDVVSDPARLAEIEERLHQLRRLKRKYGGSLESVLAHEAAAAAELAQLDDAEQLVERAHQQREQALQAMVLAARALSAARGGAAAQLGEAFTRELASLGMGEARVLVEVAPLASTGAFQADGARLTASGMDRAEFLIAANRGEQPRPLRKIASGGELSRALLALKRVLAGMGPVGTYVFDEVDTGVGGAVAEVIGRKLAEVARHHQVICITHLPQIAACAGTHFYVQKLATGERTTSTIRRLGAGERVEEIARMLGGLEITAATRQTAEEMMARAARLAAVIRPSGAYK